MNMPVQLVGQWVAIIGIPLAIVVLLIYGHRHRTDIFLEVGDTFTTIIEPEGRELLRLSNQVVTHGSGRKERIIAVGKPGEFGFPLAAPLPKDARVHDLSDTTHDHSNHEMVLWRHFLRYCGAVGIRQVRVTDASFERSLPMSRVIVHSVVSDHRVQSVLNQAVGSRWFYGGAPQLLMRKGTPNQAL